MTPNDNPTPEQLKPSPELVAQPKVINTPNEIWLCLGDLPDDAIEFDDLNRGEDICWCQDQIGSADIKYIRADIVATKAAEWGAQQVSRDAEPELSSLDDLKEVLRDPNNNDAVVSMTLGDLKKLAACLSAQQRGVVVPIEVAEEMRYLAGFALPSAEPNSVSRERYMGFCAAIADAKEKGE